MFFGIQFSDEELFGQVTTKELQLILEASPSQSEEQEEDRQLLRNFFEFGEVTVKELMVPRTNVESFPMDGTYEAFITLIAASNHDTYPIVNHSLDDVREFSESEIWQRRSPNANLNPTPPSRLGCEQQNL